MKNLDTSISNCFEIFRSAQYDNYNTLRKVSYILKSIQDNSFYYGSTDNLDRRLKEHNHGRGKYTKDHHPWKIHYF
ncbi:MAG: GIY-YIG nuclease family protein [Melioribacteraceae bacterium]